MTKCSRYQNAAEAITCHRSCALAANRQRKTRRPSPAARAACPAARPAETAPKRDVKARQPVRQRPTLTHQTLTSSACLTVRGNPSNRKPFLQRGVSRLFSMSSTTISSLTCRTKQILFMLDRKPRRSHDGRKRRSPACRRPSSA